MPRDEEDQTHNMGEGKITAETAKAILFEADGKKTWIPKSVIHDDSEVWEKGHEGPLIVKQWWAEKNGYV